MSSLSGHAGAHAVAVAQRYGVTTMFTLSGGHVFPLYDGAVKADPPVRPIDVRHEQTAVFAAEATGRLTRIPGLAVVTAGPGVTNSVSAVTSAWFNGAPLVVLGGRAPDYLWGKGALQEMDHVPLLAPVTKRSWTEHAADGVARSVDAAFRLASARHRGPVFVDFPLEAIYGDSTVTLPDDVADDVPAGPAGLRELGEPAGPVSGDIEAIAALVGAARRPVLVLGSDVWLDGAETHARWCASVLRLPVIANGQARGILPGGHELLVTRARPVALGEADLVIVVGVPLDFRLKYGAYGPKDSPARVVHVADSPAGLATHAPLAASAAGDLAAFFHALAHACELRPQGDAEWLPRLRAAARVSAETDVPLLASDASPVHPMRVYGELLTTLAEDAVVIGDGGDFVSFAGRLIEPALPGRWLDPGPYGCLGTGLGYAMAARIAHPSSQVVLLLGDGAAGLSLMDVDTLVRHNLPVVMIVGNNSAWGLEKEPMRAVYGYDVAADLRPETRYDEVVRALGGAGELVTQPGQIAGALKRAFAAEAPYLINVITDIAAQYPRTTTGV